MNDCSWSVPALELQPGLSALPSGFSFAPFLKNIWRTKCSNPFALTYPLNTPRPWAVMNPMRIHEKELQCLLQFCSPQPCSWLFPAPRRAGHGRDPARTARAQDVLPALSSSSQPLCQHVPHLQGRGDTQSSPQLGEFCTHAVQFFGLKWVYNSLKSNILLKPSKFVTIWKYFSWENSCLCKRRSKCSP